MSSRRVIEITLSGLWDPTTPSGSGEARIEVDAPAGTTREEALALLQTVGPHIAKFWGVEPRNIRGEVVLFVQERRILAYVEPSS